MKTNSKTNRTNFDKLTDKLLRDPDFKKGFDAEKKRLERKPKKKGFFDFLK